VGRFAVPDLADHPYPQDQRLRRMIWFRRVLAWIVAVSVLLGLAVVGLLGYLMWSYGGGPAERAELLPLPAGVQLVNEAADCPGNGDGWLLCVREVRLRQPGLDRNQLRQKVIDHYASTDHPLRRLSTDDKYCTWFNDSCAGTVGEPDCLAQKPSKGLRCLYVLDATKPMGPFILRPTSPDEIDVQLQSYTHRFG
jgi:hypothetical protein